jgi:hypothetical protein
MLDRARPGDYVALLAYVAPTPGNEADLQAVRSAVRDRTRLATTLGFGPRYLHSTGQLHKGGPNTGVYLEITSHDALDVPIPGAPYGFSTLKQAQALGDLESLRNHGRRAMRLHLGADLPGGLKRLTEAVRRVAAPAR